MECRYFSLLTPHSILLTPLSSLLIPHSSLLNPLHTPHSLLTNPRQVRDPMTGMTIYSYNQKQHTVTSAVGQGVIEKVHPQTLNWTSGCPDVERAVVREGSNPQLWTPKSTS